MRKYNKEIKKERKALSPLLDGGKSMGYTLARWENMASSWNRREILVVSVHPCLYPTARLGTAFSRGQIHQ